MDMHTFCIHRSRIRIYVGGITGSHEKQGTDLLLLWAQLSSLWKPALSPPSVCHCRRYNRWQGGCAGRRSGPSWCGRPCHPRWPGCGAAPRAALIPPSGVGAATRSWAVLWLWAALLDHGSIARRWQTSIMRPRHTGNRGNRYAQEFSWQMWLIQAKEKTPHSLQLNGAF